MQSGMQLCLSRWPRRHAAPDGGPGIQDAAPPGSKNALNRCLSARTAAQFGVSAATSERNLMWAHRNWPAKRGKVARPRCISGRRDSCLRPPSSGVGAFDLEVGAVGRPHRSSLSSSTSAESDCGSWTNNAGLGGTSYPIWPKSSRKTASPKIGLKPAAVRYWTRRVSALSTFDGGLASEVLASLPSSVPRHVLAQSTVIPAQSPLLGNRCVLPSSSVLVDSFSIAGGSMLSGHAHISGAKNSALAVLAGALCSSEEVCVRMVPDLLDIQRMLQVLRSLGVRIQQRSCSEVVIDASNLTSVEPCFEAATKLRASFFVIGALVARLGEAVVALPGGCNIGARPVDLHVRGLEALGALVEVRQGKVHAWAANGKSLTGGTFHLEFPSVGATETLMMAGALADGKTVLSNVAQEPEVVDLAHFLVSCGARIQGAGTSTIVINGVKKLHSTDFTIIPDRIEAGTFLIAAAITRSAISLSPVVPHHLTAVINKLRATGCNIHQPRADTLRISSSMHLKSLNMSTQPYPGFPTDLQPQLMSLLATCAGESVVLETVFDSRMGHVEELQKLGARVKVSRNKAVINGSDMGSLLCGASVKANDLRAGAALVLAGMAAEGITLIEGVSHIDRGYERIDQKLRLLGANIERLP